MKKTSLAAVFGGFCLTFVPISTAAAQTAWVPGTEITGHSVLVETNGVTNTVYFDPGGSARIVTANGREVPARWNVENQSLCLETGANVRECWPYQSAFQTGLPVTLTSTCSATSRWTANSTAAPAMAEPRAGERG